MNDPHADSTHADARPGTPTGEAAPAITASQLHKSYRLGKVTLQVLRGVSLDVRRGEFLAITGASGSGKSTLLHLLGLLDRPDSGQIVLEGKAVDRLSRAGRNRMRCTEIGFVFQFYHLLGELTVLENVLLPAMVQRPTAGWWQDRSRRRARALELLEQVELGGRLKHRPKELSGGERQRVAIARALMNAPDLLLADEPTGNLDSRTGTRIMELLRRLNRQRQQTLVMVTHDAALAADADRRLHLRDGRLEGGQEG